MNTQCLAYWLDGDGHEHLMDPDLPLDNLKVTRERNGMGRLTASLPPEYGRLTAFANRPVIQEWATAIYVEIAGDMFDGFLVAETSDDNDKLSIDCVGWIGYGEDQPWSDRAHPYSKGNVPLNHVIVAIWEEVQRLRGANIGLRTDLGGRWPNIGNPIEDELPTPYRPGEKPKPTAGKQPKAPKYPTGPTLSDKEAYKTARERYDAAMKQWQSRRDADREAKREYEDRVRDYENAWKERRRKTESAEVKMNHWSTHSLLSFFQSLQKETGFSYRVDHFRNGNRVAHVLRCRYGTLGSRRHDVAFTEGENVYSIPKITRRGEDKVTSAIVLGSGDGSSIKWRQSSRPAGGGAGLRRARVFADKTLTRDAQLVARAKEVLETYEDPIEVDDFEVIDHGLAPVRRFDVGDEVLLTTFSRRAGNLERWVVIEKITLKPASDSMSVRVSPIAASYDPPEWEPQPWDPPDLDFPEWDLH